MPPVNPRSTADLLAIFRGCFTGLTHVYGTYNPQTGQVRQVKQPVTDQVFLRHLQGQQPYGVYLLVGDLTRAVVADFDEEDPEPPREFIVAAGRYGLSVYLERSKRKGWHAWIFTELPNVPAVKARLVVKAILDEIGQPFTEVFPKQDRLNGDLSYGNFINAPLFGPLVSKGRTVFVDVAAGLRPFLDQWKILRQVRRVTERQLDELIEINGWAQPSPAPAKLSGDSGATEPCASFGLPPCAQRMLAEGVTAYQRVSCFRLAVAMKKAGIPEDVAIAGLKAWAAKNRPQDGKLLITPEEIVAQTKYAYAKSYRGCGCEEAAIIPYCDPGCPLRRNVNRFLAAQEVSQTTTAKPC